MKLLLYSTCILTFWCVSLFAMEQGIFESLPLLSVEEAFVNLPLEDASFCEEPLSEAPVNVEEEVAPLLPTESESMERVLKLLAAIPKVLKHTRSACFKRANGTYHCFFNGCTQEETDFAVLTSHMVDKHVERVEGNLHCFLPSDTGNGLCTISCRSKLHLLMHCKRYFGIKDIICSECKRTFVSNSKMLAHTCEARVPLATCTPELKYDEQTQKFLCCIRDCDQSRADKKELIEHIAHHAKRRDAMIKCPVPGCKSSVKYTSKNSIVHHLQWHYPIELFTCESKDCGMTFKRSSNLYEHVRNVHEKEPVLKVPRKRKAKTRGLSKALARNGGESGIRTHDSDLSE